MSEAVKVAHIKAGFDWLWKHGFNVGDEAIHDLALIAQVALAAGVSMSPQAHTAATIAVLVSGAIKDREQNAGAPQDGAKADPATAPAPKE